MNERLQVPSNPAPQASRRRVRYFWAAQAITLLCAVVAAITVVTASQLVLVLTVPGVMPLCIALAAQGPLAAAICLFRPAMVEARVAAVIYALCALVPLGVKWTGSATEASESEARARLDRISETVAAGRWTEFDEAVGRGPIPAETLERIAYACGRELAPPLALFARVATASDVAPTQLVIAGALCGEEHTRWALAHGGFVASKHGVATSPLAFARDDRVYALLAAAGATPAPDPAFADDPPPLFYAYDAAALTRIVHGGADPRAIDGRGNSALHRSPCRFSTSFCIHFDEFDLPRLQKLLDLGLSPNLANKAGQTPLHTRMVDNESLDIIRLLLRAGADPFLKDVHGKSAYKDMSEETRATFREEGLFSDAAAHE